MAIARWALFSIVGVAAGILCSQPEPRIEPGPLPGGASLLVSGWRIQPAGRQIPLDTFPMATALSKDGRHLLVLNGGYRPPSITVLDTGSLEAQTRTTIPVADAWLGLTFSPDGKKVYAGGGSRAAVFEFTFDNGKLEPARTLPLVPEAKRTVQHFIGDVAISPDGRLLYAASLYEDALYVVNLSTGILIEKYPTGRRPYRILFSPDGKRFFVTGWADGTLSVHDSINGKRLFTERPGAHATDMVWAPLNKEQREEEELKPYIARIFVTAANTNSVYVYGVNENLELTRIESINVAMTPLQPLGMTPSALALSPDAQRLLVVCSDANAAAVVDVSQATSRVEGFLPTGWYPTAARILAGGRSLVVNGKGARSYPNPQGPQPLRRPEVPHTSTSRQFYVGWMQTGALSVIDPFDAAQLETYTKTVFRNSPYRDELLDRVNIPAGNPVPPRPGDPSPIQHVIYIVKENRTYDQVLGDLGRGNGEPSLTLFTEDSAPNHRKLANEFVLFDNFYVNADVSADGHAWSSQAIANDYNVKLWPNSYAGRRRLYDYEGQEIASRPPAGYIWTNASQAGITMRNYGFWVDNNPDRAAGQQVLRVRDSVLDKVTNRKYRGFDMDYPDLDRLQVFLDDLKQFEADGSMPKLLLLRLGSDHTSGTAAGKISPRSAMADNDLALGRLVEAVSKSRFWPKTAIFVLEDDAQNGPDHVDSHRSPAYVLSPYTRRGIIDSTMYNTTSMLRTMELILGLRPMTHYDAAARPMHNAFAAQPDTRPYEAVTPKYSLTERNPAQTATAARSARLDFSEADRIDDDELNEILWRALKGSEPPAPVRSWFPARGR